MNTQNPKGSDDGATIVETQRTIALTLDQAAYVAALLFEETSLAIEKASGGLDNLDRREQFPAIRQALDEGEAALKQIEYGQPANGATLTLPADTLWYFAHRLMADGADGASSLSVDDDHEAAARKKRVRLRQVETAIAIVDQLEATR